MNDLDNNCVVYSYLHYFMTCVLGRQAIRPSAKVLHGPSALQALPALLLGNRKVMLLGAVGKGPGSQHKEGKFDQLAVESTSPLQKRFSVSISM